MDKKRLLGTALAGAAAGLLGAVGDTLLFYIPGFFNDFFLVRFLPSWRIISGTLLTISVIPFFALGYWALSRYFLQVSSRLADLVFLGGIFGAGLGSAIHAVMGLLVRLIQQEGLQEMNAAFLSAYAPFVIPLYAFMVLILGVGCVYLIFPIRQKKTNLPGWFWLVLPLWLHILAPLLGLLLPALGDFFLPTISNLSHLLLFGCLSVLICNGVLPVSADTSGE